LEYERHARQGGTPKYTFVKLVQLAASGIVCLSSRPLRLASVAGLTLCGAAMLLIVLLTVWWFSGSPILGFSPSDSVGWTSIVSLLLLVSGVQLLMTGLVGEYVARVFDEVKGRPPWIVGRAWGVRVANGGSRPEEPLPTVDKAHEF
jgi:hypothetical protein